MDSLLRTWARRPSPPASLQTRDPAAYAVERITSAYRWLVLAFLGAGFIVTEAWLEASGADLPSWASGAAFWLWMAAAIAAAWTQDKLLEPIQPALVTLLRTAAWVFLAVAIAGPILVLGGSVPLALVFGVVGATSFLGLIRPLVQDAADRRDFVAVGVATLTLVVAFLGIQPPAFAYSAILGLAAVVPPMTVGLWRLAEARRLVARMARGGGQPTAADDSNVGGAA